MIPVPPSALTPRILVTGRLRPEDIPGLAQSGVRSIVNHRPDHEEPDQATSAEIEAEATRHGLDYTHLPTVGMPGAEVVAGTAAVLNALGADDTVLMFCKSGMRSTVAWALARRLAGEDPTVLRSSAMRAGYNLDAVPL